MKERGTLKTGEPHPSAFLAKELLSLVPFTELMIHQASLSSCSIEGNRFAEICGETLRRVLNREPVSDRYLMGLVIGMFYRDFRIKLQDICNSKVEEKAAYVQILNSKTDRYTKIEKTKGVIVSHKRTPGPYKGIKIVKPNYLES